MQYFKFGNNDIFLSKIAFGCEPLGGTDWGKTDEKEIVSAVGLALEKGCNFFDTADVYGLGRSEKLLSKALGSKRNEVFIATKGGVRWKQKPNKQRADISFDLSPAYITKAVEQSLKRLNIDRIPLYQLHWPDKNTAIEKTMETMANLKRQEKIQFIGCSNFDADLIKKANNILKIDSAQGQYNILERNFEKTVISESKKLNLNIFTYGTLFQGLLTGKYNLSSKFSANDRRTRLEQFQENKFKENIKLIEELKEIARKHKKTCSQIAIRWVLENTNISAVIVGIKNKKQLKENFESLNFTLDIKDKNTLDNYLNNNKNL
ncbi:MAG: aldo/keto reductase [Spirochaetia bacterium]|nr:aldo/keto reductase [Spirochaetia bacterium]